MAEVALQNLNKNFDEVYAVRDVNLVDSRQGIYRTGRPVGLRQDHDLANGGGARVDFVGPHPDR